MSQNNDFSNIVAGHKKTRQDDYPEMTTEVFADMLKKTIWDDSDDWKNEMYPVVDGIFSKLDYLELNTLKEFLLKVKDKE